MGLIWVSFRFQRSNTTDPTHLLSKRFSTGMPQHVSTTLGFAMSLCQTCASEDELCQVFKGSHQVRR